MLLVAGIILADTSAETLRALAWTFLGFAGLLLSVGVMVALVAGRRVAGHLTTKLGDIDLAVNNRPGPKLIEQVDWLTKCMTAVFHHLGADLPPRDAPRKDTPE